MLLLDSSALVQTTIAALMVIGGVSAKNSSDQLPVKHKDNLNKIGMGLFIGGWIFAAYVLSKHKTNQIIYILPCIGVLFSVMMMKEKKMMNKYMPFTIPESIIPVIFIISWLAIGYNVGDKFPGLMKYSGLIASGLVIASMMKILPEQRKYNNVDGIGSYMFMFAWAIITMLNSTL